MASQDNIYTQGNSYHPSHGMTPEDLSPDQKVIRFYRPTDKYGCFSNFSAHPIQLNGYTWPTVEHYFQAQKFEDLRLQDRVRMAPSPGKAAKIGRDRNLPLRKDWERVKDHIMYKALQEKFRQHKVC